MATLVLNRGVRSKTWWGRMVAKFTYGPYFLVISLIVFVALITIITLMSSTRQVTKGYVLSQLEAQHQELLRKRAINDMEISKVRSLNFIESSEKVASMRMAHEVVFLDGDTAIAKN